MYVSAQQSSVQSSTTMSHRHTTPARWRGAASTPQSPAALSAPPQEWHGIHTPSSILCLFLSVFRMRARVRRGHLFSVVSYICRRLRTRTTRTTCTARPRTAGNPKGQRRLFHSTRRGIDYCMYCSLCSGRPRKSAYVLVR
jgi:hypothetical protein